MVLKRKGKLLLLSALLGEIVSLFYPLFQMHILIKILLMFLTCLLMLSLSFDFISFKKFSILFLFFMLATFIFGGGCFALQSLIGAFPLFIVSIVGVIIYIAARLIFKYIFKQNIRQKFVYKVKIKDKNSEFEEEGYLDSGNVLYDKISGQPIMLISFDVFNKLYSNISLSKFLSKGYDLSSIKNGHYIKINSIGKGGNMLVFSVDEVVVSGDKSYPNAMLGLSLSGFEKSFGKQILLKFMCMFGRNSGSCSFATGIKMRHDSRLCF